MRDLIDKFINFLKWPVAVFAAASLPSLFQSVKYFNFANFRFLLLVGGVGIYFMASRVMDKSLKTSQQVLAHELTHAFFALLTFHKVKGVNIKEDDSGGMMKFEGKGNWLIIAAPYFFPFFCMVYIVVASIFLIFFPMGIFYHLFLGYFIGYYVDAVFSQIHDKQTDLAELGPLFCLMFLPSANLWMMGNLLAYNTRGIDGIALYQKLLWQANLANWGDFFSFL